MYCATWRGQLNRILGQNCHSQRVPKACYSGTQTQCSSRGKEMKYAQYDFGNAVVKLRFKCRYGIWILVLNYSFLFSNTAFI